VENPRQIPSYRYARRYGPRPPCFSRATLLGDARLLVGGTASILGEDSAHEGDLANQIQETLQNLASLIRAAGAHVNGKANESSVEDRSELPELKQFEELRIYHPRANDAQAIQRAVAAVFSPAVRIEWMAAELCRRELLVEMEGVARCSSPEDQLE
jgi:enamine deaminase RidA (YjgF/YER057c/UK114 family)